jgi:hypothetical protein
MYSFDNLGVCVEARQLDKKKNKPTLRTIQQPMNNNEK